ncbi:hypothetical protein DCAR_0414677 [Daucus carota subsp. sativus]|uniref:Uncharacterized protein n=1 Tax=Daucus carota subsp. sativus TaxID=79200 RepID=A0A164ZYE9_DAUCS|nr:hypothetical protein DCAR_0414677 [Daucus carota subsp. sativus]
MFRGGDLGYLPWYRKPDGAGATVAVRRREEIEEYEEGRPKWFAGDKPKGLWNEAHFRNITFLYNHNLLLRDLSMASIDKARALYLARTRATKKKEGDEETGGTPSVSLSSVMGGETGGSSHLERGRNPRGNSEDERDPYGDRGYISSGSGLAPRGPTPSAAGAVGYSLTQFQAGMGWLESPSKSAAPLEALNIFTLSLHKELMAVEDDEKLMEATREALGQAKHPDRVEAEAIVAQMGCRNSRKRVEDSEGFVVQGSSGKAGQEEGESS